MKRLAWQHLAFVIIKAVEWWGFQHDWTRLATYLQGKPMIRSEKTPTIRQRQWLAAVNDRRMMGVRTINKRSLISKWHCAFTVYSSTVPELFIYAFKCQFLLLLVFKHLSSDTVAAHVWDFLAAAFWHRLCLTWELSIVFLHSVIINHFVSCC